MTWFSPPILRAASLAAIVLPACLMQPVAATPLAEDPEPTSLAGAYLAARTADVEKDAESAARFYRAALKADPTNLYLLERAVVLSASAGDVPEALTFAKRLREASPDNNVARLVTAVEGIHDGKNADAIEALGSTDSGVLANLTNALLAAWATAGTGEVDKAHRRSGGAAGRELVRALQAAARRLHRACRTAVPTRR